MNAPDSTSGLEEQYPRCLSSRSYQLAHFPHLYSSRKSVTYADHAGATLYYVYLLQKHFDLLKSNTFGNPHSAGGPVATPTFDRIEKVRREVLSFFNVDSTSHSVVFTSGATASLKLIGESFIWNSKSIFFSLQVFIPDTTRAAAAPRRGIFARGWYKILCTT